MMTMTMIADYGSQYASSTLSSETLSGSCGSRKNRIRTIRLVRPSHSSLPPPNLTCRHGPSLGFSLRGGREHGTGFFVSYVEPDSEAQRQGLKVGDQILRVNGFTVDDAVHKEVLQLISNHTHVTLKVRSVGMIPVKEKKSACLSWQIITDDLSRFSPPPTEKRKDVRVNIMVAPRSKLGCGICKGPEWKPGIFVQFTKEGGIARDAGLRPGDQILFCNNVNFNDVSFNEAVNLMKTSRQLDLIVRKSAGSDLFPTESSGYNSSASSVTGDQSPSWSESKRLSIVREESLDLDDRIERFKLNKWKKENDWENDENHHHQYFKPTIINLSENGTTIKNNGSEEECREQTSHGNETKTVVVEVHRSDNNTHHQQTRAEENNLSLIKSSPTNSLICRRSNGSTASSSLSSAICQEIQRRSEKKQNEENKPSIDEQLQKKKILKGVTSEKQHQHNRLMDEFKQAHKKMFKITDKHSFDILKMENDRSTSLKLSQKLSERLSNLPFSGNDGDMMTSSMPPPPPPPPVEKSTTIIRSNKKGKAPPVPPVKTSTLSYYHQLLPPCPTPDYDTLSLLSIQSLPKRELGANKQSKILRNNDTVEMESLDSNKINGNGRGEGDVKPKPPDIYFESSVSTKKDQQRPVSVTIGEYPSGTLRKNPGRLDFLHNEENSCSDLSMSNQFASELAQTLSRSNLKTRTESMERLLINSQNDKGSLRILLNNNISKNLTKSVDDLAALGSYANRVTINFNSIDKKIDTPSGILKNGTHKTLAQQKSITFGETATVISDRILQVN